MKTKRIKKYKKKTFKKKSYKKTFNNKNFRKKSYRKTFNKKKFRNLKGGVRFFPKRFSRFFPKKFSRFSRKEDLKYSSIPIPINVHDNGFKSGEPLPVNNNNIEQKNHNLPPPPGYLQISHPYNFQTMIELIHELTELSNEQKKLLDKIYNKNLDIQNIQQQIDNDFYLLNNFDSNSIEAIYTHERINNNMVLQRQCFEDIKKTNLLIENKIKKISEIHNQIHTNYKHMFEEYNITNNMDA